ncbi:hypothetical protein RI129_011116 [Pyrocoelia pectoralis]|uniref:Integrase zinc-binding domain-containing protein n=1 Tax=Pyrocoelia pectoralis TaxID=417401 RepID=A0AAN7V0E3_9COLE
MDEPSSSVQVNQLEWRERFLKEIVQNENIKSSHFNVLTKDKYSDLILQVEEAEKAQIKTPLHQRRLKRFAILNIGSVKKLVARSEDNIKYYIPAEELYDVIDAAHRAVGHGGRDRLLAETSLKYANVTKQMINLYLSMCVTCQEKKTKKKRGLVSKPILHSEMNSRCQFSLFIKIIKEGKVGQKFA